MKTILCYGDSNTWGYNPLDGSRYKKKIRWTNILQEELGSEYDIISEGLNGRTTVWDDPIEGEFKNGKKHILTCLNSHKPIDLVIIFLGTNDLKYKFSLTTYDIGKSVEVMVNIVNKSECGINCNSPEVLVIIPPMLGKRSEETLLFKDAYSKSLEFSKQFNNILKGKCYLLNASDFIICSSIDGIHLEKEAHFILGKAVANNVKNICK
ncbi:SGNH/GDSL hydrolase family protein [Clostridium rectalis]|uniref:SGNH/GDSL hydrolase family protein n=1 Tax=Clostridium rectalis TaxID=2040295 RepID=UPI000F639E3E|nr:SGNH/GDSL hydrolase family protein [Clostridium rectalis]